MEVSLTQYLSQIDHLLDGLREPENTERDKEIDAIQKRVRLHMEGVFRVNTPQMEKCVKASLEELAPRIEKLVQTSEAMRPTWPSPEPSF